MKTVILSTLIILLLSPLVVSEISNNSTGFLSAAKPDRNTNEDVSFVASNSTQNSFGKASNETLNFLCAGGKMSSNTIQNTYAEDNIKQLNCTQYYQQQQNNNNHPARTKDHEEEKQTYGENNLSNKVGFSLEFFSQEKKKPILNYTLSSQAVNNFSGNVNSTQEAAAKINNKENHQGESQMNVVNDNTSNSSIENLGAVQNQKDVEADSQEQSMLNSQDANQQNKDDPMDDKGN